MSSDTKRRSPNDNPLQDRLLYRPVGYDTENIINMLMSHVLSDEPEYFLRWAISQLIYQLHCLKPNRDELDSLITAITTKEVVRTKCVTIQQNIFNFNGNQVLLHILYVNLWRCQKRIVGNIIPIEYCKHGWKLEADVVCVNPYHYEMKAAHEDPGAKSDYQQGSTLKMDDKEFRPKIPHPSAYGPDPFTMYGMMPMYQQPTAMKTLQSLVVSSEKPPQQQSTGRRIEQLKEPSKKSPNQTFFDHQLLTMESEPLTDLSTIPWLDWGLTNSQFNYQPV